MAIINVFIIHSLENKLVVGGKWEILNSTKYLFISRGIMPTIDHCF